MAGSKHLTLNKAQVAVIGDILKTEFTTAVTKLDPKFSGYSSVTQWASDRQARLFKEHILFTVGTITDAHKKAVDRMFRNYYRKLRMAGSPQKRPISSILDIVAPTPTAIDLYEADVRDDILKSIPNGDDAAYKARLTEMWLGIDEDLLTAYEAKVAAGVFSIEQRQKSLASHFGPSLDKICRAPALGGLLAISIIAYRDGDGNRRSIVFQGQATDDIFEFGMGEGEEDKLTAFKEAWDQYADDNLPHATPPTARSSSKIVIPQNSFGIPVFPSIDPWSLSPGALMDYAVEYLVQLWSHARRSRHPDGIPWDHIVKDPSAFYDAQRYSYMCFDRGALKNVPVLYDFVAKLQEHCSIVSEDPFTFLVGPAASRQISSPSNSARSEGRGRDDEESARTGTHAAAVSSSSSTASLRAKGNEAVTPSVTSGASPSSFPMSPEATLPPLRSSAASPIPIIDDVSEVATDVVEPPTRGRKRTATVDDPTDPPPPKRSKKQLESGKDGSAGDTRQRQKRPQRVKSKPAPPPPAPPAPVKAKASTKGSRDVTFQGWAFDKAALRNRAITYVHYSKVGGKVLQEADFNIRKSGRNLPAITIAEKDPAWFSSCETWKAAVKRRPE
ncbi:unnamed protein product [Peniophora sp. CBMAI 1063]|nr:unnamed protein product [Peniophora sp. CBMAI 1063]